jgi:hypothetical protein
MLAVAVVTTAVLVFAFPGMVSPRLLGGIEDAVELGMADFAFEFAEVLAEFVAEVFDLVEESISIGLEILADAIAVLGGGGFEFGEEGTLIGQVFVAGFIEVDDQFLNGGRGAAELAIALAVAFIGRHDDWRFGLWCGGGFAAVIIVGQGESGEGIPADDAYREQKSNIHGPADPGLFRPERGSGRCRGPGRSLPIQEHTSCRG